MLYKKLFLASDIVHNSVTVKKDVSNINDLLINDNIVRLAVVKKDKNGLNRIYNRIIICDSCVSEDGYIRVKATGFGNIDFIPEPDKSKSVDILVLYK